MVWQFKKMISCVSQMEKIVSTNAEKVGAAKQLLEALIDEDSEIVTILQGEDATDEEVAELVEFVEENFEDAK
ncbi:hypothetical protein ACT7DL_09855 [Bacillus paranthracis]